jgi:hypothetical protein
MSTLRTLRKLLFGETWLVPLGIAAVLTCGGLLIRPLAPGAWPHLGGFILLAGVLGVLLTSTARSGRSR